MRTKRLACNELIGKCHTVELEINETRNRPQVPSGYTNSDGQTPNDDFHTATYRSVARGKQTLLDEG